MLYLIIFATIIYATILLSFCIGILKIGKKQDNKFQSISIIIAARNEEENLPELLRQLRKINYPKDRYDIIIANDRSTDRTADILAGEEIKNPHLKVVHVEEENLELVGKKGALAAAIQLANHDILAFTDADCSIPENWLLEIDKFFLEDVDFLAGYSPLLVKSKWLNLLKNLERSSIFAVTSGSFGLHWGITCTARNMAYRKSLFTKVNGYDGIGHIRSGDDDLMLQKMNSNINKFSFMFSPDSIVPSIDKADLKSQIDLESRRASKWKYYPISIKLLSLFVFVFYLLFCGSIFSFLLGGITLSQLIIILILKIIPEFLVLTFFTIKIKHLKQMLVFPIAQLIYIPYFVYFALRGTLGKYRWKN